MSEPLKMRLKTPNDDMQLSIITPTKSVLSEEVEEITAPTENGEITILPSHVPLLTKIKPGELTIRHNRKPSFFAITGGFLEVKENKITILADYAVRAEDIEVARAKEAQERAENAMKEKGSEKDFIEAQTQLARALLELHVAKRRRPSAPS